MIYMWLRLGLEDAKQMIFLDIQDQDSSLCLEV